MPSTLSPPWISVFLTVAEQGSFNKAAEVLLLSQPAISQKIRQLENRLGTQLFQRTPAGVTLTEAGNLLYRYARAIQWLALEAEDLLLTRANASTPDIQGILRLGRTASLSSEKCLPQWLQTFNQAYPKILLHLKRATTPHLVQQIASHALHLAIIEGEVPNESSVTYIILKEIKFHLVTPPAAPWQGQKSLPLAFLDKKPFITRPPNTQTRHWMEHIFKQHNVHPHIVAEMDEPETIKRAVKYGLGVALLPDCCLQNTAAEGLHVISIEDIPLRRYLKAILPKDIPVHPAALAFLETLQSEFPHIKSLIQQARAPDWSSIDALIQRVHAVTAASDAPD